MLSRPQDFSRSCSLHTSISINFPLKPTSLKYTQLKPWVPFQQHKKSYLRKLHKIDKITLLGSYALELLYGFRFHMTAENEYIAFLKFENHFSSRESGCDHDDREYYTVSTVEHKFASYWKSQAYHFAKHFVLIFYFMSNVYCKLQDRKQDKPAILYTDTYVIEVKFTNKKTNKIHFIWVSMYLARKYWGTLFLHLQLETGLPSRCHLSHAKVKLFAGQRRYLHFSVILTPQVLVQPWESNLQPPTLQSTTLLTELILPWMWTNRQLLL